MARLRSIPHDDPRGIYESVRRVIDRSGSAVLLGGTQEAEPIEVMNGTVAVVETSGSTGYPKRVVLSRTAVMASALATSLRIGEGRWLLAVPATYVAGLQVLVRSVMARQDPVFMAGRFTAQGFAAATGELAGSARYTSLVPTQLMRVLDAADDASVLDAARSYECILVGGQALAPGVYERARELGLRVVRTYGSSETSGGCVYDGEPLDTARLRVENGEVQVAGPMLADGYLGEPERTRAAFLRDDEDVRWYRTGDTGSVDNGILQIDGRLDNVIVSGGINVSLDRVERVVRAIPGLEEAVVVPVTDAEWGQASVVVTASPAAIDDIREVVGDHLGAPARPRSILVLDELPLLASGKPDRVALRADVSSRAGL